MKIIKPAFFIITDLDGEKILKDIEKVGRVCYKSEDKITEESSIKFVEALIRRGHEAVIEHFSFSVRFICDRGVSHEIVRHRIASYSQESSRYVNYSQDKFGSELTFIQPIFFEPGTYIYNVWLNSMSLAESYYMSLVGNGVKPEEARSVLPNSVKTEIVMTANLREWRHFLKLRTSRFAHPQMREITIPLLEELKSRIPVIFDDIKGADQC